MRFTRWDERSTTETTNEILREQALWHLSQTSDCPERERIASYIASDDFYSLCHFDLAYEKLTVTQSLHLRQCLAFYQKRADIELGIDRTGVAAQKFKEAEQLCSETNDIFKKWSKGEFCFHPRVEAVFHRAQRKIATILGDVPSLSDLKVRFGPGATTQVTKRMASARRKLSQKFACSEELLSMLPKVLEELQGWIDWEINSDSVLIAPVIHRSKLSFVPKNAKTDRAIAVEPMLNSMFQLGVGSHIARRLRSVGVDIRDQTLNQRMACEGSFTGDLATLDLSSASDTIATELVYHLLPIDWALFLSSFRSGTVETDWGPMKLQKFSSMGNGFTFPLETLIFYALSVSCVEIKDEGRVTVYGDDIIVPTYAYPLLEEVLTSSGFILNPSKSFSSGPFRESCGKDYYSGIDIRPCYIKDALACNDLFVLHNFYVRTGQLEPAFALLKYLDPSVIRWGPDGFGDGHLLGDWVPKPYKRDQGWAGYTFETYSFKGVKDFHPYPGDRVLPCYTIYVNEPQIGLPGVLSPGSFNAQLINANYGRRAAFHNVAPRSISYRKGSMGVTLPGTKGYKLMSIYTLSRV